MTTFNPARTQYTVTGTRGDATRIYSIIDAIERMSGVRVGPIEAIRYALGLAEDLFGLPKPKRRGGPPAPQANPAPLDS